MHAGESLSAKAGSIIRIGGAHDFEPAYHRFGMELRVADGIEAKAAAAPLPAGGASIAAQASSRRGHYATDCRSPSTLPRSCDPVTFPTIRALQERRLHTVRSRTGDSAIGRGRRGRSHENFTYA